MLACCFSTAVFDGAVKATRDNGVRAWIYTSRVQLLRQRRNEAIAAGSSHARDGTEILIRLHTGATTFTTSLSILKLRFLPTQCIQVRHVILTFNSYGSWKFLRSRHKGMWGTGGSAPLILNVNAGGW